MEKKGNEKKVTNTEQRQSGPIIKWEAHKEENHSKEQTSIKNSNSLACGLKKDKISFSLEFLTEMLYDKRKWVTFNVLKERNCNKKFYVPYIQSTQIVVDTQKKNNIAPMSSSKESIREWALDNQNYYRDIDIRSGGEHYL